MEDASGSPEDREDEMDTSMASLPAYVSFMEDSSATPVTDSGEYKLSESEDSGTHAISTFAAALAILAGTSFF